MAEPPNHLTNELCWKDPSSTQGCPPSINLLSALRSLAATRDSAAMVRQGGYWQPMFSVLPRRFLSGLVQGWNAGERSLQKALSCEGVAGLECPDGDTR
jgi:molybdopterin-guanine dinucleotide biosynthesis protein A